MTDKDALAKSKSLPFRFITAYYAIPDNEIRDVLRQAVEFTFENLPEIKGRTAIFLDVSWSMAEKYISIGSVFAFALYKKTNGNGLGWAFSEEVHDMRPSLVDSILSQAERIHPLGGTDTYAPIRKLRKDQEYVDNIILITDEQQNMNSPFYQGLKRYRKAVNREVMLLSSTI